MNDDLPRWLRAYNDSLRSTVTYALIATVIVGFFIDKIGSEFLMGMATGAFTWWFARDQAKASAKENVELIKTPAPPTESNGGIRP